MGTLDLSADEKALSALAEESIDRGKALDLQEAPEKAEQQYLAALQIQEKLFQRTGKPSYLAAAAESCEYLADLCMQQGNMHGADCYYVKRLSYGNFRKKDVEET